MKITLIKSEAQEFKQFMELSEDDVILDKHNQLLIFKGYVEEFGQSYYDFMTLSNEGVGSLQLLIKSYAHQLVKTVDIEILARNK